MDAQLYERLWVLFLSARLGIFLIFIFLSILVAETNFWIGSVSTGHKDILLSAGISIILCGLGSRALGKFGPWRIVGSGALTCIFLVILWNTSEVTKPAMIVRITHFSETIRTVEVEAESKERLFGYFDRNIFEYKVKIEFVHLSRGCLTFRIVSMKNKNPEDSIVVNVERLKKIGAETARQKDIVSLRYNRREEPGDFSTLVYRDKEGNLHPLSSPTGECISGKAATVDTLPLDGLPSGTVSPASHEKIKEQRKTIKRSWVYVGINFGNRWEERYFQWENDSGIPKEGDVMIATGSVNRREKYIEFDPKIGRWVNADVMGQVHPGEKVKVTAVKKVARGFYWAEISQVE